MTEKQFNIGSGAMEKQSEFNITLDQKNFDVVLKSFNYMLDNQGVINSWEDHTLSTIAELQRLTEKLEALSPTTDDQITMPIDFPEWATYTSYIEHAKKVVPEEEDRYCLEDISDHNSDMEDKGMVPFI